MLRLSRETRIRIVSCLVEGVGINATCRMVGVCKHAVLKLLGDLGPCCKRYHDENVRGLEPNLVQADELWNFTFAKEKNLPPHLKGKEGYGSTWTWLGIDAESKLLLSYHIGSRSYDCALEFMLDMASRITTRCQLTTDAHGAYLPAVMQSFGSFIDYAQLIKIYREPRQEESRYSPCECIGTQRKYMIGAPDRKHISTSFVERHNLSVRLFNRRYTRLTTGYSKKIEYLKHSFAIYVMHYNYCRVHGTTKLTPAEYCALTTRTWEIGDIVDLLETQESAAIAAGSMKRGKYQPRKPKFQNSP